MDQYPTTIGTELGRFRGLGGAPVVSTLQERLFDSGEDDYYGEGGPSLRVAVRADCFGHGCVDSRKWFAHGRSDCDCCSSNPRYEDALDRAREDVNRWAQEHASECRAMPQFRTKGE